MICDAIYKQIFLVINVAYVYDIIYHKQQKLSKRKVLRHNLWFTGFHPNIGKTLTFAVFASFVSKVLPLLKVFVGKTFAIHRTPVKYFSCVAFVVHSMRIGIDSSMPHESTKF